MLGLFKKPAEHAEQPKDLKQYVEKIIKLISQLPRGTLDIEESRSISIQYQSNKYTIAIFCTGDSLPPIEITASRLDEQKNQNLIINANKYIGREYVVRRVLTVQGDTMTLAPGIKVDDLDTLIRLLEKAVRYVPPTPKEIASDQQRKTADDIRAALSRLD